MSIEILKYKPTLKERQRGLSSSINSVGWLGRVNRFIAGVTGEKEVDVVGFVSDVWERKLIGPPEDPSI